MCKRIYFLFFLIVFVKNLNAQTMQVFTNQFPASPPDATVKYCYAYQTNFGWGDNGFFKAGANIRFADLEYFKASNLDVKWMQIYGLGGWSRFNFDLVTNRLQFYTDASGGIVLFYFPKEDSFLDVVRRGAHPQFSGFYYAAEVGFRFRVNNYFTFELFAPWFVVDDFTNNNGTRLETILPTVGFHLAVQGLW